MSMSYVPDATLTPQRLIAVAVTVILHIGAFIAVKNGMVRQITEMVTGPIDVRIIQEYILPTEAPPPPAVKIETPPPFIPAPEINIELPQEPPSTTAIDSLVSAAQPTVAPPTSSMKTLVRPEPFFGTDLRLDARRSPSTDEYYPPASRRIGEEGTTTVAVCVGSDGRVIGPAKMDQTSGSARLDEAALKYAVRTRWKPATENNKPVKACASFNVKFVLR